MGDSDGDSDDGGCDVGDVKMGSVCTVYREGRF